MISGLSNIQSSIKSISSIKLNSSSLDISTSSSVSNAKSNLEKAKNSLNDAKADLEKTKTDNAKSLESSESELAQKKLSYESSELQFKSKTAKPREIDLVSLRVQISQAEKSYEDALYSLENAEIVAPFDGIVAKIYQNVGDSASPSTAILTLVTAKKLAEIDLNEVDTAKLKVGQKASLTFNAIDDLSITGEIAEIDNIGTVNQGVVNYSVKIAFDVQDSRVKPQMSITATITTNEKQDVLVVSNSALKSEGDNYYVEVFEDIKKTKNINLNKFVSSSLPIKKYVTTGDSDDENIEILSGLEEGDLVVTKTTVGEKNTKTSNISGASGMGILGGMSGGMRGGPR
jgi:RND family efflux transporter MFP subunit